MANTSCTPPNRRVGGQGSANGGNPAAATLLGTRACFLPMTPDGQPLIGAVPGCVRGGFVAAGHGCWGILLAPATGEALAQVLVASLDVSSAAADGGHASAKRMRPNLPGLEEARRLLAPFDPSRLLS